MSVRIFPAGTPTYGGSYGFTGTALSAVQNNEAIDPTNPTTTNHVNIGGNTSSDFVLINQFDDPGAGASAFTIHVNAAVAVNTVTVEYSTNGGSSWTTAGTWPSNGGTQAWLSYPITGTFSSGQMAAGTFQVRCSAGSFGNIYEVYVDVTTVTAGNSPIRGQMVRPALYPDRD